MYLPKAIMGLAIGTIVAYSIVRYFRSSVRQLQSQEFTINDEEARVENAPVWVGDLPKECEDFVLMIKHPEIYLDNGCSFPKGILLHGPPGTGKTHFVRYLSSITNSHFIYTCASEFDEIYVGSGPKNIREKFELAKQYLNAGKSKVIIFIDEIDSLGSRNKFIGSDARQSTLNQLLSCMDGIEENKGIIVIGATNFLDGLDPALTRSGRFDKIIEMKLPNQQSRLAIIKKHLTKQQIEELTDDFIYRLSLACQDFNCSDLKTFVEEAKRNSVKTMLLNKNGNTNSVALTREELKAAFYTLHQKIEQEGRKLMSIREARNLLESYDN